MAQVATTSGDGPSDDDTDAALAARYSRLAEETTGMGRRILLRLANEARARQRDRRAETIDLYLVPDPSSSSGDRIRTYAQPAPWSGAAKGTS